MPPNYALDSKTKTVEVHSLMNRRWRDRKMCSDGASLLAGDGDAAVESIPTGKERLLSRDQFNAVTRRLADVVEIPV